jgi:hypothetical protein
VPQVVKPDTLAAVDRGRRLLECVAGLTERQIPAAALRKVFKPRHTPPTPIRCSGTDLTGDP